MGFFKKLFGREKPETFGEKVVVSALHAMAADERGEAARLHAAQDEAAWEDAAEDEYVWADEAADETGWEDETEAEETDEAESAPAGVRTDEDEAVREAQTREVEALLDKLYDAREALEKLIDECIVLRDEMETELDELDLDEPEDISSDAYDIWEERRGALADKLADMDVQIDGLEARMSELEGQIERLEERLEELDGF